MGKSDLLLRTAGCKTPQFHDTPCPRCQNWKRALPSLGCCQKWWHSIKRCPKCNLNGYLDKQPREPGQKCRDGGDCNDSHFITITQWSGRNTTPDIWIR